MTVAANEPGAPVLLEPLRMGAAMRIVRRIYLRAFWVMLAVYAAAIALPTAFEFAEFLNYFGTYTGQATSGASIFSAYSSALHRSDPSGPDYLTKAFGAMLGALIYPFAVAAAITFLKNVIVSDNARFRDCLRPVLRNWLTYAQFGLVWFIGVTIVATLLGAVAEHVPEGSNRIAILAILALVVLFLFGIQYVGYIAALVCITVEQADPLSAALAGLMLAFSHAASLISIAWRSALFLVVASLLLGVVFVLTSSSMVSAILWIAAWLLFSSYLVLGIALFVLDKLQREPHGRIFRLLHLR